MAMTPVRGSRALVVHRRPIVLVRESHDAAAGNAAEAEEGGKSAFVHVEADQGHVGADGTDEAAGDDHGDAVEVGHGLFSFL